MIKNEPFVEIITSEDTQIALIIRSKFKVRENSIKFITPNSFSQQVGFIDRPKGYKIPPHIHNPVPREVTYTNEVLFIRKGKVKVDFYDQNKNFLETKTLHKDDIILLIEGGHGFTILEDADICEVKQGPYVGESDKIRF